ncbi:cobalamin-binding protein [Paraburkholderia bonniea]|nr:cobalamin-binding protein [Paraburkholderia bonniea]WJF89541.1 cobalamin-binding protein [Paraburkholderia bonniea]WJF92855.1 cobalamin-binding protein [Paraburkholderia bonniea]
MPSLATTHPPLCRTSTTHATRPGRLTHWLMLVTACVVGFAPLTSRAETASTGNLIRPRPASAALHVSDDSGASVTLAAPARRVISLAPHATELLYAAGGGAQLVGAVAYSDYPAAAQRLPRVGDNNAFDLERIIALRPDLLVVWGHGTASPSIERLRALHIPLFFSEPRQLDDVARTLEKFGQLLGTQATANAAAQRYRAQIAQLRTRYAGRPLVSVFYQVWDQPLMTLNGQNMVNDVMNLCGGRNVFAQLPVQVPTISTEAVLATNPEIIVTAAPGASPSGPLAPALERWQAWPRMTAVARHNLFTLDGDLISRPAPRIAQGAAQLCAAIEVARTRRATSPR